MKTKPIPYMRRYEISECGIVICSRTKRALKLKAGGKSVNVTGDNGKYTTRTVKGLLDITWKLKHIELF